jgi:U3 small nucleolar RNA-associated protein 12
VIGNELVILNGHRSAVTALCFDKTATRLASGSSDTDIVLWDIVSEEGLCRLKGHKDQITCLGFIGNSLFISPRMHIDI